MGPPHLVLNATRCAPRGDRQPRRVPDNRRRGSPFAAPANADRGRDVRRLVLPSGRYGEFIPPCLWDIALLLADHDVSGSAVLVVSHLANDR